MEVAKTEIKEHPILYIGQMVNAILAGQKDETRRVPYARYLKWKPGDLIWVREAWTPAAQSGYDAREDGGGYWYRE